jgi:hypothetical protein
MFTRPALTAMQAVVLAALLLCAGLAAAHDGPHASSLRIAAPSVPHSIAVSSTDAPRHSADEIRTSYPCPGDGSEDCCCTPVKGATRVPATLALCGRPSYPLSPGIDGQGLRLAQTPDPLSSPDLLIARGYAPRAPPLPSV